MKTKVLGIDPGLSGALALFDPFHTTLEVIDMPTVQVIVSGKKKRELDLITLTQWIKEKAPVTIFAMVEKVHSMPNQGTVSTFTFGRAYGAIEASVVASGLVLTSVPPAAWKSRLGVTADKNTSRARASEILPKYSDIWKLKKDDGRAEAALIAVYAAEKHFLGIKAVMEGNLA